MGLEAVVEDIREKGKKEAELIRAESKQETGQIISAVDKRVKEIKLAAETESEKQTAHIIGQEASAANLLVKRELLNTQKSLLDTVYESTRAEIARLPESFHREAIKKLLTEAKKEIPSGTISCNARDVGAAMLSSQRVRNLPGSGLVLPWISTGGSSSKVKGARCRLITVTGHSLRRCGNPG